MSGAALLKSGIDKVSSGVIFPIFFFFKEFVREFEIGFGLRNFFSGLGGRSKEEQREGIGGRGLF